MLAGLLLLFKCPYRYTSVWYMLLQCIGLLVSIWAMLLMFFIGMVQVIVY